MQDRSDAWIGVRSQFEKIDGLDSYLGHACVPKDVGSDPCGAGTLDLLIPERLVFCAAVGVFGLS
jgi:hypothetical protein